MKTYIQALRHMDDCTGILTVMAVGVNLPVEMMAELVRDAQGLPIQVLPHVDDSLSHIAAADLVVCMAGYNTLSEVVSLRKRALVVPRNGPSEEQRMRAGLFARRGLLEMLDPRDLTPQVLAQRLNAALLRDDSSVNDMNIEMNGAGRAAGRLLELLD